MSKRKSGIERAKARERVLSKRLAAANAQAAFASSVYDRAKRKADSMRTLWLNARNKLTSLENL